MLSSRDHFINRKSIIEKSFGSQKNFAEKIGISRVGLFKTLKGLTKSKLMQEHICRSLGVTKESFWPELYVDNNQNTDHNCQSGDENPHANLSL